MSEENEPMEPQGTETQETETHETEPQGNTYTPPATQADLDKIIEGRLWKERKKYADYDQLKANSEKLGEVVAQRDTLQSQLETANSELAGFRHTEEVRTWAQEVSSETGVPAELLRGETKEELEAHAKTLGKYVNTSAPVVSGDGKSPNAQAGTSTRDMFASALDGIL